jgi:hypothetical protein
MTKIRRGGMPTPRIRSRACIATLTAAVALAVGVGGAPSVARADSLDADAVRIAAAGHSLHWNWTPPGQSDRYGHAETLIHAPLDIVRMHVNDFSHYRDILPAHFKSCRVVGHGPDRSTDVYIQISVLHGVLALWDVARFAPVRPVSPGVEVVEGRMIPGKGNVEDMDVVWTLRSLDPQWTVLKFDILLKPGLPAPQSAIDEELRDSARYAVDSIHDRAQGTQGIARWPEQS